MFVHLKQSGDLLAAQGEPGDLWTPNGVRSSHEKIADAYNLREQLEIEGLLIVSGAGNVVRGEKLRAHGLAMGTADVLGRLATIQNTVILNEALRANKVPTRMFVAGNMKYVDPTLEAGDMEPYETEAVIEAYKEERVVLIGGGTGEDNKTTDNAVLEYAKKHAQRDTSANIVVLKGTKHDGVFEKDPEKYFDARRYRRISAQHMLDNYDNFKVVDQDCLRQVVDTGLSLRIYRDGQHDIATAIRNDGGQVGTLVVPETGVLDFAEAA